MRSPHRRRSAHGAITAEVAFVLPVLLAVLALGLWLVGTVITNIRCLDAARDTARAAARGEPLETARQLGQRTAPPGATITITQTGSTIRVLVKARPPTPPGLLKALPHPTPEATATLETEPSTITPPPVFATTPTNG
ncbi:TadE family type IV pilus minor pilin [Kribbella catacumbae]|uniref:TadE family type IV pilus minor pilin n=1 Tax=Kribbella catacumbae TaxID=460086 RepID=UPI0003A62EE3|nr:TadE family type IV pilus minor pilin [Kribbella catacumbae]